MYVIRRTDGLYVARFGSSRSYTRCLQHAQTFRTREEAERHRCPENERIAVLEDEMKNGAGR